MAKRTALFAWEGSLHERPGSPKVAIRAKRGPVKMERKLRLVEFCKKNEKIFAARKSDISLSIRALLWRGWRTHRELS